MFLLTGIAWPYRGLRYRPTASSSVFLKVSADKLLLYKWLQAQVPIFLNCIWNKSCSWAVLLKFWFRTDLGRENSTGFLIHAGKAIAFDFSHCHALITLYVQFLCSDWSKIDRWVHAENLCSVWNRGRGGSYFPYILLNEIQTMFSQPADLCTDDAHYVKNHRSTVLRKNKNMAVEGGTVSHYYIMVIRKFIDFMSLFRHVVWFSFSVKQFPFAELEYATYSSV